MRSSIIASVVIIIVMLMVILSGCDIQGLDTPSENLATGSIAITAIDTTGGGSTALVGGAIYLDGVLRSETTPDTLENVPVGQRIVRIKVAGYEYSETSAEVIEGDVIPLEFGLTPAHLGALEVTSNPVGAEVILDFLASDELTPWITTAAEVGQHTISVFREGYRTLSPTLQTVTVIDPENPVSISFNLQQGTLGNDEGDIAPDFTLDNDQGGSTSLHNYRGKVVLLSFFFKDCPGCIAEFPEIEEVYQDFQAAGFQVIGIDPMFFDNLQLVQLVRNQVGLSFNLTLDWNAAVTNQYQVTQYPTNIVIAQGGDIAARWENITYGQLADLLEDLLGN